MFKSELNDRVDQVIQNTKNDYARREKEMKKLLKEAEKNEDIFVIGKINLQLSMCYFDLGNRVDILPHACKAVGIFENTVRLSIGTEHIDDIIDDLENAFKAI